MTAVIKQKYEGFHSYFSAIKKNPPVQAGIKEYD